MNRAEIFQSAIDDGKGTGQVNAGYLVLIRSGRAAIIAIFMLIVGTYIEMLFGSTTTTVTPTGTATVIAHEFKVGPLGISIGSIIAAYGLLLGALGGFLWGDSHGSAPQSSSTVTRTEVKVGEVVAPAEAPAEAPARAVGGTEPMPAKISEDDVGKRTALVSKPKARK